MSKLPSLPQYFKYKDINLKADHYKDECLEEVFQLFQEGKKDSAGLNFFDVPYQQTQYEDILAWEPLDPPLLKDLHETQLDFLLKIIWISPSGSAGGNGSKIWT